MAVFFPGEYEVSDEVVDPYDLDTGDTPDHVALWLCRLCDDIEPGDIVLTSSSTFPFCARCRIYGLGPSYFWRRVLVMAYERYAEPCDCLERFGKVLHERGGHYHHTTWEVVDVVAAD